MKDKTIAAILAFFGGVIGLQRFYLDQKGMGMAHLFFFVLAASAGPTPFTVMLISLAAIFGIIDAISFLSMDNREFDLKYNQPVAQTSTIGETARHGHNYATMTDRERRFQERQRARAEKERERVRQAKERYNQRTDETVPGQSQRQSQTRRDPGRTDRERGVHYFKDYEYQRAIEAFQGALSKNSRDVASHFNIACAYSVEEEADRAFYHLDRAVALGFDDFDRIRNHDSLAYLRIQKSFPQFAQNNFRLATVSPTPASNQEDPLVAADESTKEPPVTDALLDQLQRLATLREKGLLTEVEFATQKRRLLG